MSQIIYEPSPNTHWKNLFPNKNLLLGAHNLNESEELIATIKSVAKQEIKNQQGERVIVPVARFTNGQSMVLNITNAETIASLYGEHHDNWVGHEIQIYATSVSAFGEIKAGLRIRRIIPETEQTGEFEKNLKECKTLQELQTAFMGLPKHVKPQLVTLKNELKGKLQ